MEGGKLVATLSDTRDPAAACKPFGDELPPHLRTRRQQWTALIITSMASALAAGPVASWPTLEPLLIGAGIFNSTEILNATARVASQQEQLTVCYDVANSLSLCTALLFGIWYDHYGGQWAAVCGALVAAVGLLLMAAAAFWPLLSSLMYVGYPMASIGGSLNSYGIFVFIWVLPEHQNLVSSLFLAIQSLSDTLVLVAVGMESCCGLFIGWFLLGIGALSVGAAVGANHPATLVPPTHPPTRAPLHPPLSSRPPGPARPARPPARHSRSLVSAPRRANLGVSCAVCFFWVPERALMLRLAARFRPLGGDGAADRPTAERAVWALKLGAE
eukprot:SAG11_NODE_4006_length_2110_cov_4.275982_1_plen_329_part_10